MAEADVYLAYGRDGQAEEILREALRTNPERLAIQQKLLELFAKRRDFKSFAAIAELAFQASQGQGPDWQRIRELGQSIDATNPLYQAGGQPGKTDEAPTAPVPLARISQPTGDSATPAVETPATASVDIDLDLDFSSTETPSGGSGDSPDSLADTTPAELDLNLDHGDSAEDQTTQAALISADASTNSIEYSLPEPAAAPVEEPKPGATAPAKFDMLEFDLSALSLDLDDAPAPASVPASAPGSTSTPDPLATKLALAEEFQAIGDSDGARELIEEVITQASGDLKIKAQNALSKLSSA